jgi:hypothetical protein
MENTLNSTLRQRSRRRGIVLAAVALAIAAGTIATAAPHHAQATGQEVVVKGHLPA